MRQSREIKGIYDADLPGLLQTLGLQEAFDRGEIRCAFSDEVLTRANLLGIFSDGQDIKFVCNNEIGREKFAELNQNRNVE